MIGGAQFAPVLSAGYSLSIRLQDNLSDSIDQTTDDGGLGFALWEANWFLGELNTWQAHHQTGFARLRHVTRKRSSMTAVTAYSGVQDGNTAKLLRRSDGALTALTYGDLCSHLNGDTANVVRYDTPDLAGFTLSDSYGEDDVWDTGVRYEGVSGGLAPDHVASLTPNGICAAPGNSRVSRSNAQV